MKSTNQRRVESRTGGVWKNESLNESFGSHWANKVKRNAYYKNMKVFFELECMSTCCWGLPKPKYEPFITHNRGTLRYFRKENKNKWIQQFVSSACNVCTRIRCLRFDLNINNVYVCILHMLFTYVILSRDASIRYSVSVSAPILAFSNGSGIGQTIPIQIRYCAYTILCYCWAPRKHKNIIKHQKVFVHYIPSVLKPLHSLMWGRDEYLSR